MNEVMEARAVALVMNKEVEYHHTDGNTHIFIGNGHNISKDKQYEIRAEILPTNEIAWSCDCHHAQFNDDCKHMLACGILMKKMIGTSDELREEHKVLSSDIK